MKVLSADELLTVWEQGLNQPLLRRALILLAAAFPEIPPDNLAQMSIGQRDGLLMQLRECLFGQALLNTAVCPECAERLEWQNLLSDFLLSPDQTKAPLHKAQLHEFDLDTGGYQLLFRLPNSLDIAAVINSHHLQEQQLHQLQPQQRQLLSRCLLKIEQEGNGCDFEELPDAVLQTLSARLEALDPQADIRLNLTCPECAHEWTVLFDIASFLWTEVNDWSERMLQTVYQLAAAYGWSEQEILRLSPVRRQLYLGLMGA
ncbi:hypothetical protein [Neptunomonas qingdaonensis]|uniref:Phage baseplate protein n=1 Tax=Neptunomonas qingdaonensis TaxID=1045558 RepID=A0A1I2PDA6_9GAMM|nr:hypothetical protein [Neptunomonas qingdaonensis]SFG14132.1 hypothetical protein SAMN05216175_103401 [Neptunomonas qingdaonensis]